MSHQSGIKAASTLEDACGTFQTDETIRVVKIVIQDEELVLADKVDAVGDFREDWDSLLVPMMGEDVPCYVMYRLDSKNARGNDFIFIAWSPDFAHIRQKMLYASTRATLKQAFGTAYIKDEMFGTVVDDITLDGYDRHRRSAEAPAPLTAEEVEKAEIKKAETGVDIGASTKHTIATGVSFPMSEEAIAALEGIRSGTFTYVQLSLDTEAEIINLAMSDKSKVDDIAAKIPDDEPRYHVFNFRHNVEGDTLDSLVFVYSCPGYNCSIKQRMLYSTCKSPLVDVIEDDLKFELTKKLEIGEAADWTQDWLYDQLHPPKTVFKAKFARPARPGKGGRRLIRGSSRITKPSED